MDYELTEYGKRMLEKILKLGIPIPDALLSTDFVIREILLSIEKGVPVWQTQDKLVNMDIPPDLIEMVLEDLERLGYVSYIDNLENRIFRKWGRPELFEFRN